MMRLVHRMVDMHRLPSIIIVYCVPNLLFNNSNIDLHRCYTCKSQLCVRILYVDTISIEVSIYYYRIFCKYSVQLPSIIIQIIPKWSIRHYFCFRGYWLPQHHCGFYKKNIIIWRMAILYWLLTYMSMISHISFLYIISYWR